MLRGNIAATSLKTLLEYLVSVKCYDKSNMNAFTLSLWENIRWGLIYFDQFRCGQVCADVHKPSVCKHSKTCFLFDECQLSMKVICTNKWGSYVLDSSSVLDMSR